MLRQVYYRLRGLIDRIFGTLQFSGRNFLRLRGLRLGQWVEMDEVLFEAVFEVLRRHVEDELSGAMVRDVDDPVVRRWRRVGWWERWRRRQYWKQLLGLAYLNWAATLIEEDLPLPADPAYLSQTEVARETRELYLWYMFERPRRLAIVPEERPAFMYIDEAGVPTNEPFGEMRADAQGNGFFEMRQQTPEALEFYRQCWERERAYIAEDTRQAQRVLAIRTYLWS